MVNVKQAAIGQICKLLRLFFLVVHIVGGDTDILDIPCHVDNLSCVRQGGGQQGEGEVALNEPRAGEIHSVLEGVVKEGLDVLRCFLQGGYIHRFAGAILFQSIL